MTNNSPLKNSLRKHVANALHDYFSKLEGESPSDVYNLVLYQIEAPLIEITMHYTKGNQTQAANWLGLNRSTLRKLLAKYKIHSS